MVIAVSHIVDSDEEIVKIFRERGLKVTPQRIAISRLTLHNPDHLTVKKIYNKIQKRYPSISLTTVYRTIHVLKEAGLIQELRLPGEIRIDPHLDPHMHLVLVGNAEE